MELILASASPRRRELLSRLGLSFTTVPADIDEAPLPGEAAYDLVQRLSSKKAQLVAGAYPGALVIAADTVVVLDNEIMNKPRDKGENRAFIRRLSDRVHHVHTGHAVVYGDRSMLTTVTTAVRFRKLSPREIDWYVATGEGLDKAGGYGIQGYGAAIVKSLEGCYFNVMGMSLAELVERCRELGVELVG